MEGYLGEETVQQKDTPFKSFNRENWAMYFLERYGGYDGAHHKDWVLDQMARILKGTEVEIKLAKWSNGNFEYRINTVEPPSQEYIEWVAVMCDGEDGPNTYSYEEGIAP